MCTGLHGAPRVPMRGSSGEAPVGQCLGSGRQAHPYPTDLSVLGRWPWGEYWDKGTERSGDTVRHENTTSGCERTSQSH